MLIYKNVLYLIVPCMLFEITLVSTVKWYLLCNKSYIYIEVYIVFNISYGQITVA